MAGASILRSVLTALFVPLSISTAAAPAPPRAATLLIDLRAVASAAPLVEDRRDVLDTPVAPGSIAKTLTLLAALESGTITPSSTMACPRRLRVGGDTYTCTHPDAGRPLTPAEALAHSCNGYFASIASRLPRAALERAYVRAGLEPPAPGVSTVRAALGLDGVRATPRQWLGAFARLAAGEGIAVDARYRRVLLDGLRGAATYGTARSLGDAGITALAKTGTSTHAGGQLGLVVAVLPADHPTHAIVVVVPGAAGLEAAALAAERLHERLGVGHLSDGDETETLTIGRVRGGRHAIEAIALEDYVAGVVAAEAPADSPGEESKALAIVVRTFALANRGRHRAEGFDLCDLTHCQVLGRLTPAAREAAAATRGRVLMFQGKPAQVFYSASCGGHSERPSAVWPGASDPPYLVARPEPACRLEPAWTSDVSAAQVTAAMRAAGARGGVVRWLRVRARTASGRVAALEVGGFDPPVVSAEAFRLALGRTAGWQLLKSTAFEVERRSTGYRFVGRGRGHGVGLCVDGAVRLARAGRPASAILQHYFPGSALESAALARPAPVRPRPPSVEVVVPSGEEAGREAIRRLAGDALSAIADSAGLPAPPFVRLVFHPTVQAYARETGLPWWTAGASRGTRVDLLPPSALRRRRLLERTVRHEIAHVVIGGRLAGRPLWVQEGAAMFLAGELDAARKNGQPSGHARQGCPSDQEMARARAAAALQAAYRRAAACFASDLENGRRWDEVGLSTSTR